MSEDKIISLEDIIEISSKTVLSAIPIGGTLINAVWDSVKGNVAQRRLDEWKELIEDRLSKLEITLNEISSNEKFATAMFYATESAIRTSEKYKREYLANAVLNSISTDIDESIMMIYLNLIEKYTTCHIKIIDFFDDPLKHPNISVERYYMGSPLKVLFDVYSELSSNQEFVNKIIKDLYNDGILNTDNMNCTMTASGMVSKRTTLLGHGLIDFICQ